MLGVYIPTYGRPEKLASVAKNIEENTHSPFKLYWGVEPEDRASILAAKDTGHEVVINTGKKGYSNTIQSIYEQSDEPLFFPGNDDFYFLKDWDERAVDYLQDHTEIMVLGVHDGNPKTRYFTVHFIRRSYIQGQSGVVDMPNRVYYPYHHNYQDTEFSETALSRGVWGQLDGPCIEHHNPGLAHLYDDTKYDDTYAMNDKTQGADAAMYQSRMKLWQNLA